MFESSVDTNKKARLTIGGLLFTSEIDQDAADRRTNG
jgi:hypothetical protein